MGKICKLNILGGSGRPNKTDAVGKIFKGRCQHKPVAFCPGILISCLGNEKQSKEAVSP